MAGGARLADGAGVGELITHTGKPVDYMYIPLAGRVVFYSEKGGSRRKIFEWGSGEIGGVLPYSRLRNSPGIAIVEEATEMLVVSKEHFPELVQRCPTITAACVHTMLDRARLFTRSDLHDEKMASLGKLAAGLAHELNNPASAAARSAKLLAGMLAEAESAAAPLAMLDEKQSAALAHALEVAQADGDARTPARSALEASDREEEFRDWIEDHGADGDFAHELARTRLTIAALEDLAKSMNAEQLAVALRWMAATSAVRVLSGEIENAAARIYDLVSAVKRFTYMDRATAPEPLRIGQGIRDTVAVMASKARAKSIAVEVDVPDDLPLVLGYGGELNQVWLNLLDNALDAAKSKVSVSAKANERLLTVRFADDGPGISAEVRGKIFDPFFTTKPMGQGTGLGLDIVRRILERHEADIAVESRSGHTEFCVTFPRA